MQRRGSPHIHMMLWVRGAPDLDTPEGRAAAPAFIDQYVSAKLPDPAADPELHSLVSRYQVHNHTFTCGGLDGGPCRFRYPKRPCEATRLRQDGDLDLRRGDAYVIARGEGDGKIVPYSPALLSLWGANMDLQFIGSAAGAAAYVTAYLTKAETDGIRETVQEAVATMPEDAPTEQLLRRACMALLSKREYSMQEAAYLLIGATLHLRGSSRKFVKLCVRPKQERPGIASRRAFDAARDRNAEVELAANIFDYYAARPVGSTGALGRARVQRRAVGVDAEGEQEDTACEACGSTECDEEERFMLLCSTNGCRNGYHGSCLDPPVAAVPDQGVGWFCPPCRLRAEVAVQAEMAADRAAFEAAVAGTGPAGAERRLRPAVGSAGEGAAGVERAAEATGRNRAEMEGPAGMEGVEGPAGVEGTERAAGAPGMGEPLRPARPAARARPRMVGDAGAASEAAGPAAAEAGAGDQRAADAANHAPHCTRRVDAFLARNARPEGNGVEEPVPGSALPDSWEDVTLFMFASEFDMSSVPSNGAVKLCAPFDGDAGRPAMYVRRRAHKPAVLRCYPRTTADSHGDKHYFAQLLLHKAWRAEEDLTAGHDSALDAFRAAAGDPAFLAAVRPGPIAHALEAEVGRLQALDEAGGGMVLDQVHADPDAGAEAEQDEMLRLYDPALLGEEQLAAADMELDAGGERVAVGAYEGEAAAETAAVAAEAGRDVPVLGLGARMTQAEYDAGRASLSPEQREVFSTVFRHVHATSEAAHRRTPMPRQLLEFVTGGGGTGKSFLIKLITEMLRRTHPEGEPVVLTAPTGVAAFNIRGTTIHRALGLPVENCRNTGMR